MRNKLLINILLAFNLFFFFTSLVVYADSQIPWSSRHFPNAPRTTAEQALLWRNSGVKIVVVDVPYSRDDYIKSHVCGAVYSSYTAEILDRLIRRIPKDYLIISYCK